MSQGEVQIKISTVAELRFLKEAEQGLIRQITMAKAAGKEYAGLAKELAKIQNAISSKGLFRNAQSELLGFVEKIPVVGAVMRSMNGAVGPLSTALGALTVASGAALAAFSGLVQTARFGGKMADLGARTGESVRDVTILGQAFRNAGMDAGAVGPVLNMLQSALGGVNDEGMPTADVFKRIGLNIAELRTMPALEQLRAISEALGKLPDQAAKAKAVREIFGRQGGAMLPLLTDPEAISTAKTQVGRLADNLNESVAALDKFSDAWDATDLKKMQFFAGFAKGLSGDLEKAADSLNRMDFSRAGQDTGNLARGVLDLLDTIEKKRTEVFENQPSFIQNMALYRDPISDFASWLADRGQASAEKDAAEYRAAHPATDTSASGAAAPVVEKSPSDLAREKYEAAFADMQKDRALQGLVRAAQKSGDTSAIRARLAELTEESRAINNRPLAQQKPEDFDRLMQVNKEYNALRDAKSAIEEKSSEKAAQKTKDDQKAADELQAKKDQLDIETRINEAKARGADVEARKLEWVRDYNKLVAKGMEPWRAQQSLGAKWAAEDKPADKYRPDWITSSSSSDAGRLAAMISLGGASSEARQQLDATLGIKTDIAAIRMLVEKPEPARL